MNLPVDLAWQEDRTHQVLRRMLLPFLEKLERAIPESIEPPDERRRGRLNAAFYEDDDL